MTEDEYLAAERIGATKHEFFEGQVFAMAGASIAHITICSNLVRHLGNRLDGTPCRALGSDMRVKVEETGLYTYPDAVIVCGEAKVNDQFRDTLLNPRIVFEVLPPSTERYDRGTSRSTIAECQP